MFILYTQSISKYWWVGLGNILESAQVMAPTATVLLWDIVTSYLNPVLWQSPNCLANYHLSSASRVIILKTWFKLCHSAPNHSFLFFLTKVKSEFLTMVLHAVAYHPLSDLLSNLLPKSLLQDLCACCILSSELITLEWLEDGSHQLCYGRCSGALKCLGQTLWCLSISHPLYSPSSCGLMASWWGQLPPQVVCSTLVWDRPVGVWKVPHPPHPRDRATLR